MNMLFKLMEFIYKNVSFFLYLEDPNSSEYVSVKWSLLSVAAKIKPPKIPAGMFY